MADGPRLAPLPPAAWDERLVALLEAMPGGTSEPMYIFTTLARQPALFRRWLGFGGALLNGQLPGRLRELVILRTAHRFGGRYEWAHHIALGRAQGITEAELAAVSGGALQPSTWSEIEGAVLRSVDETADQGAISDATWQTLAAHLNDGELVELVMLIGHYLMLSTVLRSLRLPLEPSADRDATSVPGGPPE